MMMEQYGYGMAMDGYAQVPEYADGYPISPYGGSVRERADHGPGLYGRRELDSCWDRMSSESGCNNNNISMDDPYTHIALSSAPERGGRGGPGRGGGGGTEDGGGVVQLSPYRQTLVAVDAGGNIFESHPPPAGHLQLPKATPATHFPYVDWRGYVPCSSQYYPVHEAKKYCEIGDIGERPVQSVAYLPQGELYDCPPVASTYPTELHPGIGQAQPFCQPSPPETTVMSDGWQGGSVTSEEVVAVEEVEKRRNPYRAAAATAANLTAERSCSGHRSQVTRFASTSSSSLASSRRGCGGTHSARKQGSSHHQRRLLSDLSGPFLDEDERKLRERDRKKKDNHNLIERKRRLNINANIKVLGTLLPPSPVTLPKDSMQNKGNILRSTVEFVQSAQQKIERLHLLEHRLRDLHATNRQLRRMLKELETFLRATGFYEDYLKTVGDKDSPICSASMAFDIVKEETNFSPASLPRQESDVTDDCTGG